jgi:hypothetical protein
MRKLLLLFFALLFSTTAYAKYDNFAFDLSKEDGINLLKGETDITLVVSYSVGVQQNLIDAVVSDIKRKLRVIGVEAVDYKWGISALQINISLLDIGGNIYSGKIDLTFSMPSRHLKTDTLSYTRIWEDSALHASADQKIIRKSYKAMMDKFLNVYLEANPRKFNDSAPPKTPNKKPPVRNMS